MRKSLRNQALRGIDRLITGTHNGENWYVPGGWYATKFPVYDGYKVLKSQIVSEAKPDMGAIIDKLPQMVKATEFERGTDQPERSWEKPFDYVNIRTIDMYDPSKVNALYFDFLKDLHPDAEIRISEQDKYAPVCFYEGSELVALLMPLKR
jgi:hypothetical protein